MRQKQVKKGPDESGPAAGDQKGYAYLISTVYHKKYIKIIILIVLFVIL